MRRILHSGLTGERDASGELLALGHDPEDATRALPGGLLGREFGRALVRAGTRPLIVAQLHLVILDPNDSERGLARARALGPLHIDRRRLLFDIDDELGRG